MQVLVSVADGDEAAEALAGGADVIDAKDPARGPLGPVRLDVFGLIRGAVPSAHPVSAALGDATGEHAVQASARHFAAAGASFVKLGFAGVTVPATVGSLVRAAVSGASEVEGRAAVPVVAVAYADGGSSSISPWALLEIAATVGAGGVLLDTCDKEGPGLLRLMSADGLARWVDEAHASGLFVAVAGRLAMDDLAIVRETGADIAGVRGAACEGGRTGRVSAVRVRALRSVASDRDVM